MNKQTKFGQDNIIIVGCGKLGASIANLRSNDGESVIVVDINSDAFNRLNDAFSGLTIISNANELSFFDEVDPKTVKEIIITTGDDNLNIFLAHVSRAKYGIPTIVVRLDDPERGDLLKGFKVKTIFPLDLSMSKFNSIEGGR